MTIQTVHPAESFYIGEVMATKSVKKKTVKKKLAAKKAPKKVVRNVEEIAVMSEGKPAPKSARSETYYSVREVSILEEVTDRTVYNWIKDKRIIWRRATMDDKGFRFGDIIIPKSTYKRPIGWKRTGG